MSTKKITNIALVSVFAYLSVLFIHFPISFLTYDIKSVIIAIGGFVLGTVPAIIICVVVSVLEMITVSTTGVIGLLMNITATIFYIMPICIFYHKKQSILGGVLIGTISLTVSMFIFNMFITPIFVKSSFEETIGLLFSLITPFNIFKGITNGIFILILYKPIVKSLSKSKNT